MVLQLISARGIKPVVTLDATGLDAVLNDLWAFLEQKSPALDGIVGIATGGAICARLIARRTGLPAFDCALRRPSTASKSKPIVRGVLGRTPYPITNWMRRLEDRILERRTVRLEHTETRRRPEQDLAVLTADVAGITRQSRSLGLRHLALIDDAVDSGATLGTVASTLRAALPDEVSLTTAVVTQTRRNVSFKPDVAVFHDTLVRFPWSYDFRGGRIDGQG